MSEDHGPAQRWSVPSLRRIGEFLFTIVQLERSYQSLKADVEKLNKRLSVVEEKLTDQGGQLKILASFVQNTVERQIEEKTKEATRQIEAKAEEAIRRFEAKAQRGAASDAEERIPNPPEDDR